MDNNNGPNMTPMNPNKESPMTTPKMVMSGWAVSYTHLTLPTSDLV